jgi:hypothetical protein
LIRYYRAPQEYRKNELKVIPVIPKSLEGEILQMAHATSGCHNGETKTIGRIKGNFHFPKIYSKVKTFIQGCEECAKQKSPPKTPRFELSQCPTPSRVGELKSIDIWGTGRGLPVSRKGNRCVLTIVAFQLIFIGLPNQRRKGKSHCESFSPSAILGTGDFPSNST